MVVMVVIAALAGLLVPAVAMVRAAAHGTACSSNLRQLGIAIHLYADEHHDFLPTNHVGPQNWYRWSHAIADHLREQVPGTLVMGQRPKPPFACPASTALVGGGGEVDYGKNWWTGPKPEYPVSRSQCSSGMLLLADAHVRDLFPGHIDYRHQSRANVLFIDNHIERRAPSSITNNPEQAPWR